ncbi:MAG: FkbM family methyltransferase [Prevotellaceae bacterium]|jgi:FkbM family methyltransferase|nr:FkbM family methyltransferase [Prevotellaceae bacterium]
MTKLYRNTTRIGIKPNKVAEVGVYKPETSNVIDYIEDGIAAVLVEPDPMSIRAIKERFAGYTNVNLHEIAIYDYCGKVELSQRMASTFISDLSQSPAIVNDKYFPVEEDKFTVECLTYDKVDDGQIDILSIDIEGAEWFVLKYMKSRPKVISVETHGKFYLNPFLTEIKRWMADNQYTAWFKNSSDSVYVRNDVYRVSSCDKIKLKLRELRLWLRRLKRTIK